jgi:hypothetical protein
MQRCMLPFWPLYAKIRGQKGGMDDPQEDNQGRIGSDVLRATYDAASHSGQLGGGSVYGPRVDEVLQDQGARDESGRYCRGHAQGSLRDSRQNPRRNCPHAPGICTVDPTPYARFSYSASTTFRQRQPELQAWEKRWHSRVSPRQTYRSLRTLWRYTEPLRPSHRPRPLQQSPRQSPNLVRKLPSQRSQTRLLGCSQARQNAAKEQCPHWLASYQTANNRLGFPRTLTRPREGMSLLAGSHIPRQLGSLPAGTPPDPEPTP